MSTVHTLALAAVVTVAISMGVPLAGAGPAAAHTELVAAEPPQDATVTALEVVRLRFTDPLRQEFSTVAVTAADGARVDSGSTAVTGTEITVPVAVTGGGSYTVAYRVLSADGHPVEGSYAVIFAPPPPPAASAAAPPPTSMATPPPTTRSASPTASDEPGGGASGTVAEQADAGGGMSLVGVGGGLLSCAALVGAGLVWRRRMRDHA